MSLARGHALGAITKLEGADADCIVEEELGSRALSGPLQETAVVEGAT